MKKYKKILFVVLCVLCFVTTKKVNAEENYFYGTDVIGYRYNKVTKDGRGYARTSTMIQNKKTGKLAYCLEPFQDLYSYQLYPNSYRTFNEAMNLTKEQYHRVVLLAYYGYQYKGHEDVKWYTITQMQIWKTIEEDATFMWLDDKGYQIKDAFKEEIQELEQLVKKHDIKPDLWKEEKTFSVNEDYEFEDKNNVLSNYTIKKSDVDAEIKGNKLVLHTDEEKTGKIVLERKDTLYKTPAIMYYSSASQNVMEIGSYEPITMEVSFTVESGTIKIKKIDKDTKDFLSSGDASLVGTKFQLLDQDKKFIQEITISEDGTATIPNLKFGTYYIQEKESGIGYKTDDTLYEVILNKNQTLVELVIENEIIKGKVSIKKYYGTTYHFHSEANVEFEIYNKDKELVEKIVTDENGEAQVELPYGTYTFHQVNGKENYQKVEDFVITIYEEGEIEKELYDLEIPTPNTSTMDSKYLFLFLSALAFCSCIKLKR